MKNNLVRAEWIELADHTYTCGLWSEADSSAEIFNKEKGCGRPAAKLLRSIGENPSSVV